MQLARSVLAVLTATSAAFAVAVPASAAVTLPPGNLAVNGGFEQPNIGTGGWRPASDAEVTGWSVTCGYLEIWPAINTPGFPNEGNQSIELDWNPGCRDAVHQPIATTPGDTYEVRFSLRARGADPYNNSLQLEFGSSSDTISTSDQSWREHSRRWIATSTSSTLRLTDAGYDNGWGTLLDGVSVVRVDTDGDNVSDSADNCPTVSNAGQANLDGDALGDACDGDRDDDTADNDDDAFPDDVDEQLDTDEDGVGDNADKFPNVDARTDADDDGIADGADNCATVANGGQADLDGDGEGDACDGDRDGDGVANADDNAPDNANADQADLDCDGVADVIDTKVLPLTAAACKKNGWTSYYDNGTRFKNQGDCVSFVATGSRNLPAG